MSISTERTIPRLVEAAAGAFATRNAVEDGDVTLTFPELAEAGLRAARAFCASGIQHGDRVAIWAPNIFEWIVATIGLQSAGAVLVPLNTRLKGGEAAYILNKSGAKLLFTMQAFLGTRYVEMLAGQTLPALEEIVTFRSDACGEESRPASNAIDWSEFLSRADGFAEDEARARGTAVSPDDISDILFTSGTTGKPKGVMTAHGQNLKVFESWSEVVGLKEGDRYLIQNPFFHSFGYKAGWLSAIMRGATALPHQVFDIDAVLERIGRDRISVYPAPPSVFQAILAHPGREKYDLSSLRLTVTGAAPVPVEMVHQMRDELGFATIITGYGLTETCGVVAMCRFDDDPETIALTSGRAIPDTEVRCVDDAGKEVPRGEPGEVVVRGYNLMRGYFDDEAETAKTVDAEGWLHTGDIGDLDADGYLSITDRKKELIITSGGKNISPQNIEALLKSIPAISQAATIGDGRKYVTALVTLDPERLEGQIKLAGSPAQGMAEAAEDEVFRAYIAEQIGKINQRLSHVEGIKRFKILGRDFSEETGELTPTMKLKRRVIAENFGDEIEGLYQG